MRPSSAGFGRREAEGLRVDDMGPVITIMMGRLEDWLRVLTERDGIVCDPDAIPWAGVAVFKRAYRIFQERGPACPSARGGHPSSLPLERAHRRRVRRDAAVDAGRSASTPRPSRCARGSTNPSNPRIVDELLTRFPDFARAYEPDGLAAVSSTPSGPTARTLRAFIASYHDLLHAVTDAVLPNPDVRAS